MKWRLRWLILISTSTTVSSFWCFLHNPTWFEEIIAFYDEEIFRFWLSVFNEGQWARPICQRHYKKKSYFFNAASQYILCTFIRKKCINSARVVYYFLCKSTCYNYVSRYIFTNNNERYLWWNYSNPNHGILNAANIQSLVGS